MLSLKCCKQLNLKHHKSIHVLIPNRFELCCPPSNCCLIAFPFYVGAIKILLLFARYRVARWLCNLPKRFCHSIWGTELCSEANHSFDLVAFQLYIFPRGLQSIYRTENQNLDFQTKLNPSAGSTTQFARSHCLF